MTRVPAHDRFDADFHLSAPRDGATRVIAWVKRSWAITARGLERTDPLPLAHPMHRDHKMVPGSDYWPFKRQTDVVVVGSAHAPEHRPLREMEASVAVGARVKRVRVTGPRQVSWRTGETPVFPEPEMFTEIPLGYGNAYGGVDARVVDPSRAASFLEGIPLADHPGMYPRNPFGRGYVVSPEGAEAVDLPFLEDPEDLLTPERFITGDPARWHSQPLPAGVGWIHPWMFPRGLFFDVGTDAWFPAPDDASLREVREGVLPSGYRAALLAHQSARGPHEDFSQESSLGLRFAALDAGTPCALRGVHPERPVLSFATPPPPALTWRFDDALTAARPRLHHLVVEPDALRVSATYAAEVELPRAVIPGVHGRIPLALRVDDDWCEYAAPKTVVASLREAGLDPLDFIRQQ